MATVPGQPENSKAKNAELVGLSNISPPDDGVPEDILKLGNKTKDTNAISYAEVSPDKTYVSAETITTLAAAYSPAVFV